MLITDKSCGKAAKFKCKALLATLIAVASFGTFAAEMNAGTIHFTGEIIDPSCEIAGAPGHDITVPLGTYPASLFTAVNVESTSTLFRISLEDCPLSSVGLPQVQLTFTGTTTVTAATNLLDVTGGATNVGIAISKLATPTTLLELNGAEDQVLIDLPTTTDSLITESFLARYKAFAVPVGSGPANANLTVNILYH